jgi:3-methyl-2-oxobutanoate hydroxymethyltransferase
MLGIFDTFVPSFVKQYAQLGKLIVSAAKNYASDVRFGNYPPFVEREHTNGALLPHSLSQAATAAAELS